MIFTPFFKKNGETRNPETKPLKKWVGCPLDFQLGRFRLHHHLEAPPTNQSPTGPQPPDSRLDSVLNTLLERRARPDIGNLSTECAAALAQGSISPRGFGSGKRFKKKGGIQVYSLPSVYLQLRWGSVYIYIWDSMGLSVWRNIGVRKGTTKYWSHFSM